MTRNSWFGLLAEGIPSFLMLSCFADVAKGSFDDLLPLHANGSNNADTRRWITRMARFNNTIKIKVIMI